MTTPSSIVFIAAAPLPSAFALGLRGADPGGLAAVADAPAPLGASLLQVETVQMKTKEQIDSKYRKVQTIFILHHRLLILRCARKTIVQLQHSAFYHRAKSVFVSIRFRFSKRFNFKWFCFRPGDQEVPQELSHSFWQEMCPPKTIAAVYGAGEIASEGSVDRRSADRRRSDRSILFGNEVRMRKSIHFQSGI